MEIIIISYRIYREEISSFNFFLFSATKTQRYLYLIIRNHIITLTLFHKQISNRTDNHFSNFPTIHKFLILFSDFVADYTLIAD